MVFCIKTMESITVKGLQPQAPIILTLTTRNDASQRFLSYSHYVSDNSGTVDVERSETVGGAYTGVFPAGLLSSLKEFPYNYTRLQKEDPTTLWLCSQQLHSPISRGQSTTVLQAWKLQGESVTYEYIRDPPVSAQMTLAVHEGHLTVEQSAVSEGLTNVLLERHIMAPGVRREPIVHERVQGSLFFPSGPGLYPAVIDIFGAAGGLKEYRACVI
ncbi:acyl-coenzyme A thioesterase 2, mitochondrial-like [Scylla paramamosain]|uniref:acyl-coenzyme A thioesterase 2, mitochondrial-like n=1 Tax=Scylla paramamosain TaxID=85552 RepID=UPI0030827B84